MKNQIVWEGRCCCTLKDEVSQFLAQGLYGKIPMIDSVCNTSSQNFLKPVKPTWIFHVYHNNPFWIVLRNTNSYVWIWSCRFFLNQGLQLILFVTAEHSVYQSSYSVWRCSVHSYYFDMNNKVIFLEVYRKGKLMILLIK